jgi:hypothetical protein
VRRVGLFAGSGRDVEDLHSGRKKLSLEETGFQLKDRSFERVYQEAA